MADLVSVSVSPTESRVRYPLRAVVAVVLGALVALAQLVTFALFMMPLFPLVPVFVAVMLGNAMWLSSLVRWAASLGKLEPVRKTSGDATTEARAARSRYEAHAA